MKAGAKPFEDISKESANEIKFVTSELRENIDDICSNLNDVIDIIAEQDPLNRKDLIENLKLKKKSNLKPKKFKVVIVYAPAQKELADQIRKSLNRNGNAASMQTYEKYKTDNAVADYYIMLGIDMESEDRGETLFLANGCHIEQNGDQILAYLEKINLDSDDAWKTFSSYYKSVTDATVAKNEIYSKANKARNTKAKRNKAGINILDGVGNAVFRSIDYVEDKVEELPLPLMVALGIPAMFLSFALGLFAILASIPVGLTAVIFADTMEVLDKKSEAAISDAQKQILLIKIVEHISNLQIKHWNE